MAKKKTPTNDIPTTAAVSALAIPRPRLHRLSVRNFRAIGHDPVTVELDDIVAVYWQHGYSTERDFLYVTTASLTHEQLQQLSDEVGPERTLLVLCTAFRAKADAYPNLTVKKIPKQVLSRCEWGHDDYSLQVENLPQQPPHPSPLPEGEGIEKGDPSLAGGSGEDVGQRSLFGAEGEK